MLFQLGRSLVLRQSNTDKAVIVTGGVTLHEALKAHQQLAQQGINVRVVDIFSVKPLDVSGLKKNVTECGGNVVVVEDHYAAGKYSLFHSQFSVPNFSTIMPTFSSNFK